MRGRAQAGGSARAPWRRGEGGGASLVSQRGPGASAREKRERRGLQLGTGGHPVEKRVQHRPAAGKASHFSLLVVVCCMIKCNISLKCDYRF